VRGGGLGKNVSECLAENRKDLGKWGEEKWEARKGKE